MSWIREFAASTPFEVPGLVEASVRLEAYGLNAKKYMRTLGDTAGAMGKPIMSAVEMVADASQGEFERLKEFGLRGLDVARAAGFETVKDMTSTRENLAKGTEALMEISKAATRRHGKAVPYLDRHGQQRKGYGTRVPDGRHGTQGSSISSGPAWAWSWTKSPKMKARRHFDTFVKSVFRARHRRASR